MKDLSDTATNAPVKVGRGAHTIGYTVGTGRRVRFDPAAGPTVGRSSNLLLVGAYGMGKSYAAKQLAYRTVRSGGRVLVLSVAGGEYEGLVDTVPDSQVVPLTPVSAPSAYSLDPTRIFREVDEKRRYLADALSILCGEDPDSRSTQFIDQRCGASPRLQSWVKPRSGRRPDPCHTPMPYW